jgi:metal-responsive CopG/Arc/MetJ family transcriptional regulator
MKPISIGFEDALLSEMNKKARVLNITRAELIRNAILEYLFRFDDVLDSKMLSEAIKKDEDKKPIGQIARELNLE